MRAAGAVTLDEKAQSEVNKRPAGGWGLMRAAGLRGVVLFALLGLARSAGGQSCPVIDLTSSDAVCTDFVVNLYYYDGGDNGTFVEDYNNPPRSMARDNGAQLADTCTVQAIDPSRLPSSTCDDVTELEGVTYGSSGIITYDASGNLQSYIDYTESFCEDRRGVVMGPPAQVAPQVTGSPQAADQTAADMARQGKGDPVNPFNGELLFGDEDLAFPGFGVAYQHARVYRSRVAYDGPIGYGWDHTYNRRLIDGTSCAGEKIYLTGEASTIAFKQASVVTTPVEGGSITDTTYQAPAGVHLELRGHTESHDTMAGGVPITVVTQNWTLAAPSGLVSTFDHRGLLTRIEELNHQGLTLDWEASARPDQWRLATVTDSAGREIQYEYDPDGRVASVIEPVSGLGVTYQYDALGNLISATQPSGRTETYEYAGGWPVDEEDYFPEGYLRAACEKACAPSTSSCDAGGVCDDAATWGLESCRATCSACDGACEDHCDAYCDGEEAQADCRFGADEPWYVDAPPGCVAACEASCEAAKDDLCDLAWDQRAWGWEPPGAWTEIEGTSPHERCDACDSRCTQSCVNLFNYWDWLYGNEWHAPELYTSDEFQACEQCCANGRFCDPESCQGSTHSSPVTGLIPNPCADECRRAFFGEESWTSCDQPEGTTVGGCPVRAKAQCNERCVDGWTAWNGPDQVHVPGCMDDCAAGCRSSCDSACNTTCTDQCEAGCALVDYATVCPQACLDSCIAQSHAAGPASGPKYGYPKDLNHNLLRVRDGNGVLYLENEYGEDLGSPSFDAVIDQQYGGFGYTFEYRDLRAEADGLLPAPTGPSAGFVEAREDFETVDICPTPCGRGDELPSGMEVVPWWFNTLVVIGAAPGAGVGGFPTSGSGGGAQLPLQVFRVVWAGNGYRAISVAPGDGAPWTETFSLSGSAGTVTFQPQVGSNPLTFQLSGSPAAINQLVSLGEITAFTDLYGAIRVYPRRPAALLHLASGACTGPFRTETNELGQLQITPSTACAGDLRVSPLATRITDPARLAQYDSQGPGPFANIDELLGSDLVPGRYTFVWRAVPGVAGRYEPTVGPARGAAPESLGAAVFDALLRAPVLQAPPLQSTAIRPLFVFHLPAESRPVGTTVPGGLLPVWDQPGKFDAYAIDPSCVERIPDEPRRGAGSAAPGPKPERATFLIDAYGAATTTYYDGVGHELREVVHETGAQRSFNYDAAGDLVGVELPLHDRVCLSYGDAGVLLERMAFPAPGAPGTTAPVRERFAYTVAPVRLAAVYDPRDPTRILQQLTWDGAGNLLGAVDGTGLLTAFTPSPWGPPAQRVHPDGAVDTFQYDPAVGAATEIAADATGPFPAVTDLAFDEAGRLLWSRSPFGEEVTRTWDGTQLVAVARNAEGLAETYTLAYDANGQLAQVTDGRRRTSFAYGALGFAERQAVDPTAAPEPGLESCRLTGPTGRLLEEVLPGGTRRRFTYDAEGRATRVEAGRWGEDLARDWDDECPVLGGPAAPFTVETVDYDANGNPLYVFDARGMPATIEYDGFNRPVVITDAVGTSIRLGYDALGNVTWRAAYGAAGGAIPYRPPLVGDPGLLAAAQFLYDDAGRMVRRDDWHLDENGVPIGDGLATTVTTYDLPGRRVTTTNDLAEAVTRTFDGLGRPLSTLLPTGSTIEWTYSADGRAIRRRWSAPTPAGVRDETLHLTGWGAPLRVETNDLGAPVVLATWEYDPFGRPIRTVDAAGLERTTAYDFLDRPARTETLSGEEVHETIDLVWDEAGRLVARTSDGGASVATTAYEYDLLGRLARIARPEGVTQDFSYYAASGQVASILDARGITTSFTRLPSGDVEHVVAMGLDPAAARSRHFERDGLGRLLRAIDDGATTSPADDVTVEQRWDSLGNRVAEWNSLLGASAGVTHRHDSAGRAITSTLAFLAVERGFDGLGRLEDLRVAGDTGSTAHFAYAGLGPPVEREVASGVTTSFTYDALGRAAGQADALGATPLATWRWAMPVDGVPRLAGLRRGSEPEVVSLFEVDRAGRVLAEAHELTGFEGLTLSAGMSFEDAAAEVGEVTGAGSAWRSYTLDGRHNWLGREGADPALATVPGTNPLDAYTSFGGAAATYDEAGALAELEDEIYAYDAFGELVDVVKGGVERRYVRDALGRIVQEIDPATGAATTFGHDGLSRAIRKTPDGRTDVTVDGQAIDEHLVRVDETGARLYYHQDPLGSVYAVSDEAGAVAEWITYTAFGEPTILDPLGAVRPTSAVANRFGFQGHPFDPATGLVDMRARAYRPAWGRFTRLDPIGFAGGHNLYAFVSGAPLVWRDPLGWGQEGRQRAWWEGTEEDPFAASEVPEGVVHRNSREAWETATAPGAPWWDKIGGGALALASGPLAMAEEGVRYGLNTTHDTLLMGHQEVQQMRAAAARGDRAGVVQHANNLTAVPVYGVARGYLSMWALTGQTGGTFTPAPASVPGGVPAEVNVAAVEAEGAVAAETTGAADAVSGIGRACSTNCFNVAVATERTLAGAPASALEGSGVTLESGVSYLRGLYPSGTSFSVSSHLALNRVMSAAGEGTRAVVFGSRASGTGHVFNAVVENGRVVLIDGGRVISSLNGYSEFTLFFSHWGVP